MGGGDGSVVGGGDGGVVGSGGIREWSGPAGKRQWSAVCSESDH